MKAVILAGGYGTRLAEETTSRPKPMVEIGARPILWHIMKIYASHGISEFIICCGYKGEIIKEFFVNYFLHTHDITVSLKENEMCVHRNTAEDWRVTLIDTGEHSMTGGRLRRVREYLGDSTFCFTYGDGVGDIDIANLVAFHEAEGRLATLTAVQPPGRFGAIALSGETNAVSSFQEKPVGDKAWVNAGFFVLEPSVLDYIESDTTIWEAEPLQNLARKGELSAYRHRGFWQPMDTLRDKHLLERLWEAHKAPWKVWE